MSTINATGSFVREFTIVVDFHAAGVGAIDSLRNLIDAQGPLQTTEGALTLVATAGGYVPGIGIVANTALIITAAANSDATNNSAGAKVGSVITMAASVLGLVGTLAGLAGITGIGLAGLAVGGLALGLAGLYVGMTSPDLRIGDLFNNAQSWVQPRRDPLVLDLDGDGLETTGVSTTNPILFDHDGDGIKSSSGWIKPDDGFLV